MTQDERLDFLISAFTGESAEYAGLEIPRDVPAKRRLLRSLMNVRPPRNASPELLVIQDAYLSERNSERGTVGLNDIPVIRDGLSVWQGDITLLAVDAIVNAANSQMLGCFAPLHACIDNCIHTYAGIQLRADCDRRMRQLRRKYGPEYEQPTSVPMLTDAYNLPSRKVVHVVGPIVRGHVTPQQEKELSDCYRNVLDVCEQHDLHSVAFCCISTGVFCFPNQRAAELAVAAVTEWKASHRWNGRVVFNVFKDEDRRIYEELLR